MINVSAVIEANLVADWLASVSFVESYDGTLPEVVDAEEQE